VNAERFDTAAARAEMAQIDAKWEMCDGDDRADAFHAALDLLDRALAAIDAGWPEPAGDVVERAAIEMFRHRYIVANDRPCTTSGWPIVIGEFQRNEYRGEARAVLRSAGRMPEPVNDDAAVGHGAEGAYLAARVGRTHDDWLSLTADQRHAYQLAVAGQCPHPDLAPFAITDAMVAEATKRAWCAANSSGIDGWKSVNEFGRKRYTNEARAVLEYAATLQPAAPAHPRAVTPLPVLGPPYRAPAVAPQADPRDERLTRYRCAAPAFIGSDHDMSPDDIAGIVENIAHAMLAAERPAKPSPIQCASVDVLAAYDAYKGNVEGPGARDLTDAFRNLRAVTPGAP
jgi:hypothetical protein